MFLQSPIRCKKWLFSNHRIFLCMCPQCSNNDISATIIIKIIYIITFLWVDQWGCYLLGDHSTFYIINNWIYQKHVLILCRFDVSQKKQKIHRNWHWFEIKCAITLEISRIGKRPMGIRSYIPIAFKWYDYHFIILNTIIDTASSPLVVVRTTRQKACMNNVSSWV